MELRLDQGTHFMGAVKAVKSIRLLGADFESATWAARQNPYSQQPVTNVLDPADTIVEISRLWKPIVSSSIVIHT